jgi:hypothetical protein
VITQRMSTVDCEPPDAVGEREEFVAGAVSRARFNGTQGIRLRPTRRRGAEPFATSGGLGDEPSGLGEVQLVEIEIR